MFVPPGLYLTIVPRLTGSSWIYKMNTTKHSNSCTRVAFQAANGTLRDFVIISLLAQFMTQPFYVEMRIKQQLGYDLGVSATNEIGYTSKILDIYVQGERDPVFVEGRINQFLINFRVNRASSKKVNIFFNKLYFFQETLSNMTETEFKHRQLVQYNLWNIRLNDMSDYGLNFWKEILHGHYRFRRDSNKLFYLYSVTLTELREFYDVRHFNVNKVKTTVGAAVCIEYFLLISFQDLIGFQNDTQRRLSIHVAVAGGAEPSHSETTTMSDVYTMVS